MRPPEKRRGRRRARRRQRGGWRQRRGRSKESRSLAPSHSPSTASSSLQAIGPGPIIFGVACVVCFVGAVALLPAHENTQATGFQPASISSQPSTASGRQPVNGQAPAPSARNSRAAAKTESQHAPVIEQKSTPPTVPASEPVKAAYSGWATGGARRQIRTDRAHTCAGAREGRVGHDYRLPRTRR